MAKKTLFIFFTALFLFSGNTKVNAIAQKHLPQKENQFTSSTPQKKRLPFYKKWTKRAKQFRILRNQDELWLLKVLFVVVFLGIITFALSAIMLAIGGTSLLWLTLMIIGGITGILPILIAMGALLLDF